MSQTKSLRLKHYLSLTKPGIIIGNLITATGGFFLAAKAAIDLSLLGWMLLGISSVIGSACVFNNYIDRHYDKKMSRTKNRPLAQNLLSPFQALFFATLLGLLGFGVLAYYTTLLSTLLALVGFIVYVIFYSFLKYHWTYTTWVGSIAGATPPLIGYCALSSFDYTALVLFALVALWQMPHFFSIAIYRLKDYQAIFLPVFPLKKGIKATKIHMFFYTIAYVMVLIYLFDLNKIQPFYFVSAVIMGTLWIWLAFKGLWTKEDGRWARKMFFLSLGVITVAMLSICLSVIT